MGIISRASGTPYVDGATLPGARLEGDISTIYTEFNGAIGAANLGALSVPTSALQANAVTQAKMTSGAASASEAVHATGSMAITSTPANLGTAITHTVGNPARHVIIMVSFEVGSVSAGNIISVYMLKDGVGFPNSTSEFVNFSTSASSLFINRTFVDIAPTAGGTHIYQLQAKSVASSYTAIGLVVVAFEPRN